MKTILPLLFLSFYFFSGYSQTITTSAGNGTAGNSGDGGPATSAQLNGPWDVAVDAAGNRYIASFGGNVIRKVFAGTGIITTICGTGVPGSGGDGGQATSAQLNGPIGVCVDNSNNVFITEYNGNRVRRIDGSSGVITTIIGTGTSGYNGDGPGISTQLSAPWGIAVDPSGNVYFTEWYTQRIRKWLVSTSSVTTLAGTGIQGYTGDGGPALSGTIYNALDIALDQAGNVYWAEYSNNVIRKLTVGTGVISTVAGTGLNGFNGNGIPATTAQLSGPAGVVIDLASNIYISEYGTSRIRKVTAGTGLISAVAGSGSGGFSGDGGPAISAQVYNPGGLAGNNSTGDLFISDVTNNRVRSINNIFLVCSPPPMPTNVTSPGNQVICSGSSASLSVSGSGSLNWYNSGTSTLVLGTGTGFLTPTLSTGTYTFYAAASNTCTESQRTAITVTVQTSLPVSISGGTAVVCPGTAITLTASGADNYLWGNGNTSATIVVTPTSNIFYSVMGTSTVNSCSGFAAKSVSVFPLTAVTAAGSGSFCTGQNVNLGASGALSYTWEPGSLNGFFITVSPPVSTDYTVSGSDNNGCVNSATVSVTMIICTGLEDLAATAQNLSVSPNPGSGEFRITLNGFSHNCAIEVHNALGQLIFTRELRSANDLLDLHSYPGGLYWIRLKDQGKQGLPVKVVKE
jgi:hypothetical protein